MEFCETPTERRRDVGDPPLPSEERQGPVVLKNVRPLDGLRRDFVRDRLSLTVRAFGGWRRRMKLSRSSCSRARFRRVGMACRVPVVLAKVRRNWLGMLLPGMRLQRRARLARSKWSVCVTR